MVKIESSAGVVTGFVIDSGWWEQQGLFDTVCHPVRRDIIVTWGRVALTGVEDQERQAEVPLPRKTGGKKSNWQQKLRFSCLKAGSYTHSSLPPAGGRWVTKSRGASVLTPMRAA